MKKRGFLIYLIILGFVFIPKMVFAKSFNVVAGAGRSAVMNPSGTYYYTQWKGLSSDSLNILPIPYPNGDYYLMGSEYSFAITLTGETSFRGHVTIPVAANTIYNYTMTNGLLQSDGAADLHFGIDQNFGVYNMGLAGYNATWSCNTYTNNLGVAHNLCFYDIEFSFNTETNFEGAYNLNVAVLNTTGNRSAYYYSGIDSNGNGIEFPVNASGTQYSTVRPYLSMTGLSGDSSSPDNTDEILNGISQASSELSQTIQESYENLVKSQEVCIYFNKDHIVIDNSYLNNSGELRTDSNYGITDFYSVSSSSVLNFSTTEYINYCFYNSSKTLLNCSRANVSGVVSVPSGASFVRFTINKNTNKPSGSICQNGNQAISNQLDGLLDQSTDGIDFTFGDIDVISDTPVSDLLLLPLELITKITTSLGSGCMTWDLPFNLWGNSNYVLHMPCIDPEDYFGSSVWIIIDDLFCIFMIYNIFKMLLRFFESWSSLNDTFDDVVGGVR